MSGYSTTPDRCVILVKALPHGSSDYFETVCCAGIGPDRKWRRLYPVPFRILDPAQKFGRWHWISYEFSEPRHDGRRESQKVNAESIKLQNKLRDQDRARLLQALTRSSTREAEAQGDSLTLIKPRSLLFSWRAKTDLEISEERAKHARLADQLSLFNRQVKPLEPCRLEFSFKWEDQLRNKHTHVCDDWETTTAYYRRRDRHGEEDGLADLKRLYEVEYLQRGLRFALGTHSRRNKQWLLVGVLRVDENAQQELI